ncbi:arginine N-succinyltransferase [Telluria beijingensis]|uniref:arginine N-succinyltransferase n=1 Tax=Telluria beijingensis TaxID=3068633 RepID=UPI0027958149|nr:arginine N-succinyltransferase [Massilia sp. REN29]
MFIVRAATPSDLDAVLQLAASAGPGMTTLKADRQALAERLALAQASFAQTVAPELRDYVFVLEDLAQGRVGGIAAIKAAVGLDEPFYNYRLGTLVHSAAAADVYVRHEVLYLSHDLTGSAELCSLFLHPDYRRGGAGKLLSKSRFLFIAEHPHLFARGVFAEMRGYQDAGGGSPFWESVGRKFFGMDFARADDMCQPGAKSYIAELMPRYPIYTCFLSDAARAAIGQTHVDTAPARRLLEQEGLRASAYIDIFDGGPVLQATTRELRATRESMVATVAAMDDVRGGERTSLACTAQVNDFRVIASSAVPIDGVMALAPAERRALQCDAGRTIHVLGMAAGRSVHRIGAVDGQAVSTV